VTAFKVGDRVRIIPAAPETFGTVTGANLRTPYVPVLIDGESVSGGWYPESLELVDTAVSLAPLSAHPGIPAADFVDLDAQASTEAPATVTVLDNCQCAASVATSRGTLPHAGWCPEYSGPITETETPAPALALQEPVSQLWVCTDCMIGNVNEGETLEYVSFTGNAFPCETSPNFTADMEDLPREEWAEDGNGIHDFSWDACEGCGSTLGGARYRFAVWYWL